VWENLHYTESFSESNGVRLLYSIGIDIGGTKIAIGIIDEHGRVADKESIPTHNRGMHPPFPLPE